MNSPSCLQHPECQIGAGGSIRSGVEEQSPGRNARATFFSGELLIWVNYRARIAWPGSWAHVSARGRRVPLRQTGRRAYLGFQRSRRARGALGLTWRCEKHLDPTDLPWQIVSRARQRWVDQRKCSTKDTCGPVWGNWGCNQGQKLEWKAFISIYNVSLSSHKESDWFKSPRHNSDQTK